MHAGSNVATPTPPSIVLSPEGVISHVSESVPVMWGYEHSKEIVGRRGRELWANPEDAVRARAEFDKHGFWQGSFLARHRRGHEFVVYGKAWRVHPESPDHRIMMLVSCDQHGPEVLAMVGHPGVIAVPELVLRGAVHDLNNIVGISTGAMDIVRAMVGESDPRLADALAMAADSCSRAKHILSEMAGWLASCSDGGRAVSEMCVYGIAERAARMAVLGSKTEVRSFANGELWPVRCHEHQVFRVFVNLCLNARQAMQGAGMISLRAANVADGASGAFVRVSVSDTGPGMTQETLSHIFSPGFSTRHGGAGIGLASSRQIVQENGGRLEVESAPGRGTTFHVWLPAAPRSLDQSS